MLQSLRCQLLGQQTQHEMFRILQMYSLFVGLLLQEADGGLGGSWPFILRDVIYTTAHVLQFVSKKET